MLDMLESALREALGSRPALLVRYTDLPSCELLWACLASGEVLTQSDIVIVYDGQADRTTQAFRPEHWLTPWDWAIAVGMAGGRDPKLLPPGGVRCWIVDLLPSHWGSSGRARFKTVGAMAPWVRWYRPLSGDRPLVHSFTDLYKDLARRDTLPALCPTPSPQPENLALMRAWTALFSAPTDRHSIGNLIGPSVLSEGFARRYGLTLNLREDSAQRRFRELFNAVGLIGAPIGRTQDPSDDAGDAISQLRDSFRQYQSFDVVLIDDQYDSGYHSVLSQLLLGSDCSDTPAAIGAEARCRGQESVRVRSSSSPSLIFDALRAALSVEPNWSRPRLLSEDLFDVLCLDLRLFPTSNIQQPSSDERSFLQELLRFCEETKVPVDNDPDLATALAAAARRAAGGVEELQSICLLPLLINRVDPSLPIILFSSTHQRDVVALFRRSPSVITTFAKPIVSGYSAVDLPIQCAEDLVQAFCCAHKMRGLRGVWMLICRLSRSIGVDGAQIHEKRLTTKEGLPAEFTLDAEFVRILASEYQRLFPSGRFADAIQLPDNLMEKIGAKFETPASIKRHLDIFVLDRLKGDADWVSGIHQAYLTNETRALARTVIEHSLRKLTRDQALKQAVDELASHIGNSRSRQYDLQAFSTSFPHWAQELEARYGSLSQVVASALGQRLKGETARLGTLKRNGDAIAAYQFYSVLAGMRNGRSHFRVRPEVHDEDLEFCAGWLWMFFIEGLQLLIAGKRPIRAGKFTDLQSLVKAATAQWYPTSTFVDSSEGEAFCTGIVARFGQMLTLGIFSVDSELKIVATFAQRLARNAAGSELGGVRDDLSLATKADAKSGPVHANTGPVGPKAAEVPPIRSAQVIEASSTHKPRPPRGSTYRPFEDALRGLKS